MKTNFTLDDLLLHHYNEMPAEEVQAFELCLQFDETLGEQNASLIQVKVLLDSQKDTPSDSSIRLILDYNRQNSNELEAI